MDDSTPSGRNPAFPARPRIVPVIMSGGAGTRLWPLSTNEKPKQFHALASRWTLLEETVSRVTSDARIEFLPPIVVCSRRHCALVEAQLAALDTQPGAIVLEPVGRNTAAVAVVAARLAEELYPGALVLLAPADHVIADAQAFRTAILRGVAVATDRIVTFGIEPTGPETGYGYIQRGAPLGEEVYEVARFVEKPKRDVAEAYLATGGYDWNAGIFLFSPATMLREMEAYRPDILHAASAALKAAERDGLLVDLDEPLFAATPSEPIDVAVMEPTKLAAVAPCAAGWADVGSWSELWRLGPLDQQQNLLKGSVAALDTSGSLIWGDEISVAVLGLTDVIVVASQGAVLVLPRSRSQEVKALLEALPEPRKPT